jgi:hypothetical protein
MVRSGESIGAGERKWSCLLLDASPKRASRTLPVSAWRENLEGEKKGTILVHKVIKTPALAQAHQGAKKCSGAAAAGSPNKFGFQTRSGFVRVFEENFFFFFGRGTRTLLAMRKGGEVVCRWSEHEHGGPSVLPLWLSNTLTGEYLRWVQRSIRSSFSETGEVGTRLRRAMEWGRGCQLPKHFAAPSRCRNSRQTRPSVFTRTLADSSLD